MQEKALRKLIAWKRTHALSMAVYKASEKFPRHARFGSSSQMRRSAVSAGAKIAEGVGLGSSANYQRHLNIASRSLAEIE